jgi:hypothetical protein
MTDNLATVELSQFKRKLGSFSAMQLVDAALARPLALKLR